MALYQPGKRSNITFFLSSIFTLILLACIITGHIVMAFELWFYFTTDNTGMEIISTFTGLSKNVLWLSIIVALIMDIWVAINMRKGHQKSKKR